MKKNNKMKSQKGFSLLEMMMVLIVIGGLIVGVVVAFNKNQNSANANKTAQDIQSLASGVKTLYSSSTDGFAGASIAVAINAGLVPKTLTVSGDKVKNKYNGDVTITTASPQDGYTPAFAIIETKLPVEVITKAVGALGTDGVLSIAVGKTTTPTQCIYSTGTVGAGVIGSCPEDQSHPYNVAEMTDALKGVTSEGGALGVAFAQQ